MTETTVLGFPHGEDRDTAGLTSLAARILDAVRREIDPASLKGLNRGALARRIKSVVERAAAAGAVLNL
jgi:deoxyribose-phosphate aldolase